MKAEFLSVTDFAESFGVSTYCLRTIGTIIGNDTSHKTCKFLNAIKKRFALQEDFVEYISIICSDCFKENRPQDSETFTRLVAAELSLTQENTDMLVAEVEKYNANNGEILQLSLPFDWSERQLYNSFTKPISTIAGIFHVRYTTAYKTTYSVTPLSCINTSKTLLAVALARILGQHKLIIYGLDETKPFKEEIDVDNFKNELVHLLR